MKKHLSYLLLLLWACSPEKGETPLYKDATAPVERRVEDLMSRMTLEEKVGQMCQYVGIEHIKEAEKSLSKEEMERSDAQGFYPDLHSSDIERMTEAGLIGSFLHVVNVKEANYLQTLAAKSRLGIPLLIGIDAIHGTGLVSGATVYPSPIGMASGWDTTLVREIAVQTAVEMRATGSAWTFTPNLDVAREPRWGRVGETFGEDPFLVSALGKVSVEGLQNTGEKDKYHVISCGKHLLGGSESVNGLNGAPTDISERSIREIYLPPFQVAVDAGMYSVMTAHNELNGIPCHSDKWMMTDVLRGEMGFEGFYVSDWMDIERLVDRHHTAANQKEACYQTIEAGMDMHMHGPDFLEPVVALVKEGRLSEKRINESVRRLLKAKFMLGLFEKSIVKTEETQAALFNDVHRQTALEMAQKSIVLLKNEQVLPLKKGKYKNILVTGPNANNQSILGDWALQQPEENVTTILEGIQNIAPNATINFWDVGAHPLRITKVHLSQAKTKAAQADLAIVVVGENSMRWDWDNKTCGENAARSDLQLPGLQEELVEAIYASGTPTIVVLVNGRPLATTWIAEHIPVIIEAWEPGSLGGQALAEIIYGEVNPSGKLPISIPRGVGHQLSVYNHKPTHYFHEYVIGKTGPLYPFGFGLSYTSFQYQNLQLDKAAIKKNESATLSVEVTNTGQRDGEEIVQLYIRDKVSSITRPVKELKGFKRISIEAGKTKKVSFTITPAMLRFLDKTMQPSVEAGEFTLMVGNSSADNDLIMIPLMVED